MEYYSKQITKLIEELASLPGIGTKSAQRLAFHILNMPIENVESLSNAIVDARKNVRYCKQCFTLTDDELCPICKNPKRNHKEIMVVENTRDLTAYEKTGKYEGMEIGEFKGKKLKLSGDEVKAIATKETPKERINALAEKLKTKVNDGVAADAEKASTDDILNFLKSDKATGLTSKFKLGHEG